MEYITIELNDEKFDETVYGKLEGQPVILSGGDLCVYIKKNALDSGCAAAALTFTIQLPNKQIRRVQTVTTVKLLIDVLTVLKVWRDSGRLDGSE